MSVENKVKRIYPWGDGRRFNAYSGYFRKIYGARVQKVSIDAGFTCPNRDGTKGTGGCTYCNNDAFNPSYCQPGKSISMQIEEGISFHRWRYREARIVSCIFSGIFKYICSSGETEKAIR